MQIKILNYATTIRERVQAFVDLQIGPFRLNGIHFQRDGTLRSAQLTPMRSGKRIFIPAIEILDADLNEALSEEILAAIQAHIETIPPENGMRAPQPLEQRKPAEPPRPAVERERPIAAKHAAVEKPAAPRAPNAKPSLRSLPLLAGRK